MISNEQCRGDRRVLRDQLDARRRQLAGDLQLRVERIRANGCATTPPKEGEEPPPLPFKIFIATAGALQFPRRKFLLTILIARSIRYYTEGILAVYYGDAVLRFLKDNGLVIVSIVAAVVVVGLAIYLLSRRGRTAVEEGIHITEDSRKG